MDRKWDAITHSIFYGVEEKKERDYLKVHEQPDTSITIMFRGRCIHDSTARISRDVNDDEEVKKHIMEVF